ncbi:MAG: aminoacyl-tRNA hydrolase [Clostridia bacterium]|jgi:PTH1 family peptidyl-tRNA hydrolase|nr:aminoacyl-tRNA hydrolase [Clostridia bacterium]MBO7658386.1 aminoacyl-tRNA hydrolase [Clostridia bacterium]MBP5767016.1 aminoacyl-tRNA hydrolase [Clostridia bacterium]
MALFGRCLFKKKNTVETFIVAGLGNPGPEYAMTRHNCGFRAIDILAEKLGVGFSKSKFQSKYGEKKLEARGNEVRVILMKPQTYMNNSGTAVSAAADFYKVPLSNIIVIYDDFDVSLGEVRVRPGGSPGSHNGMESVTSYLPGTDFPRIRIGIGKKMPNEDVIKFVLGNFSPEQEEIIGGSLKKAADAAYLIITEGVEKAMNKTNGRVKNG